MMVLHRLSPFLRWLFGNNDLILFIVDSTFSLSSLVTLLKYVAVLYMSLWGAVCRPGMAKMFPLCKPWERQQSLMFLFPSPGSVSDCLQGRFAKPMGVGCGASLRGLAP